MDCIRVLLHIIFKQILETSDSDVGTAVSLAPWTLADSLVPSLFVVKVYSVTSGLNIVMPFTSVFFMVTQTKGRTFVLHPLHLSFNCSSTSAYV